MKCKITFLTILLLVISNVSACSFKASTENNQAASNAAKVEDKNEAPKKSASGDSDNSALTQTGGKTGTYRYKDGSVRNEINIQELEGNKLRVELFASYESKINGNLTANVGEAKGMATLTGDAAVLVSEGNEDCEINLKFSGSKIIVKIENELKNCGFGLNVSAEGTYKKENNKPNFGETNENSTSTQDPKDERVRFARGKSSTVVSGKITKGTEKVYLIGARSGQTITIKITEGARNDGGGNNDVVFHLVAPDGSYPMGKAEEMVEFDTGWSGRLSKTGDYKIVLGMIESEVANYKMSVTIRSSPK